MTYLSSLDSKLLWPICLLADRLFVAVGIQIGCRPLTDDEIAVTLKSFEGRFATRNAAILQLGVVTGFRISELLSICIKDVFQHGAMVDRINVSAGYMKGKERSRCVLFHPKAKQAINNWFEELKEMKRFHPDGFLFPSQIGVNRALSRSQVAKVFKDAFTVNGIGGKLGTHCMRKAYCPKIYDLLDRDLVRTQRAMGHVNVSSTVKYLSFREEDIDEAVLAL